MTIREAIDNIFSHNERVGIHKLYKDCSILEWRGMAHKIPEKYLDISDWKIFGLIPVEYKDSDVINIRYKE